MLVQPPRELLTRQDEGAGWYTADQLRELLSSLADRLAETISPSRPLPGAIPTPASIPEVGLGITALNDLWSEIVSGSAMLGCPGMIGHMNTAPDPIASLTDALVSQLNNNLIFQELSPVASRIEELLIREFAARLNLPAETTGAFCSGGSLANLTALFAAVGGFSDVSGRENTVLVFGESAHSSIPKAASILGIPTRNVVYLPTDDSGHMIPDTLANILRRLPLRSRRIVVATLGTTLQGAVDDVAAISKISKSYDAWLHVDAVYGGNLAFSLRHRHLLYDLKEADSIAVAPQKWLYVPRLSALVLFPKREIFNRNLDWPLPYSLSEGHHRGQWSIQASRRADAVTLWVLLQIVGAKGVGDRVDRSIDLARYLFQLLKSHPRFRPQHSPNLALQLFQIDPPNTSADHLAGLHRELTHKGSYWLSLAEWRGQTYLRAALLNPATCASHLMELLEDLCSCS